MKYYLGEQIKEDTMGGTCGTHVGEKKCIYEYFCWRT
jgi:hypothetical protein